jgi:hypothetical protein
VPAEPAERVAAYDVGRHVLILGVVLLAVVLDHHLASPVGQVQPPPAEPGQPHPHLRLGHRQPGVDDLHPHPRLTQRLCPTVGVLDELAQLCAAAPSAEPGKHGAEVGATETTVTHERVEYGERLAPPAPAGEVTRRTDGARHPDASHGPDLVVGQVALAAVHSDPSSAVMPVDADHVER